MQNAADDLTTAVVACFLLRQERGTERILYVLRSKLVREYKDMWGPVGGYLDPGTDAQEQAYIELREELFLEREAVRLVRKGEPLLIPDVAIGFNWNVHPFLFRVLAPERIHIDWEATDLAWASADIAGVLHPAVPGLRNALAQVYPTRAMKPA